MRKWIAAVLILVMALPLGGCKQTPYGLSPSSPESLVVWHYYNGAQKLKFDELVQQFNESVGAQQGIAVEAYSQGTVDELSAKAVDAASGKVGAGQVPDIFAAYADTAYEIYKMGLTCDLGKYLTQEEKAAYVPAYLQEGEFEEGAPAIMPVAKSTEVLMINQTDWSVFAQATGANQDALATWEGLKDTARRYYEWTDSLTETPDDGKAFFGRDAMANYLIIGSMQMGKELFKVEKGQVTLQVDEGIMRRLWDNYYVPYINGWYAAMGRFRSDDAKTGDIIALVGSTTGATYFPKEVTRPDATTYPIETQVLPVPNFEGTPKYAVQQGAGMVVTKSTEKREYAACVFLKWFTQPEQNLEFCLGSGYLPVTKEASTPKAIQEAAAREQSGIAPVMLSTLLTGAQTVGEYQLYTNDAFEGGTAARAVVNTSMQDKADADLKAVKELMGQGISRQEAVARFDTDENFKAWYDEFVAALTAAVEGQGG